MKSPLYWSPFIYKSALKLAHGKHFSERYELIAGFVPDSESVLDIGCGIGLLAENVKGRYLGLELNDTFVNHARKKGLEVLKQNVFEFDRFGEFDNCVIMDFLHHVCPKHKQVMERVINSGTKRVIVCEPYSPEHGIVDRLSSVLDNDGFNVPQDWLKKQELLDFFNSFDPKELKEFGDDFIAVYEP